MAGRAVSRHAGHEAVAAGRAGYRMTVAGADLVAARRPGLHRPLLELVLATLQTTLDRLAAGERLDDALVTFNAPLMAAEPAALFAILDPRDVNHALPRPVELRSCLFWLGLLADWPGPGFDREEIWRVLWPRDDDAAA